MLRPLPTAIALAGGLHAVFLSSQALAQQKTGPVQPVPIQIGQPTPVQPAQAQPAPSPVQVVAGGDTVVLNNGGSVKGTVVEILPDHVTVQLATGQLAIIPSKEVHHVERQAAPGTVVPAQPAQAGATSPPPSVETAPGQGILVHVNSPHKVNLLFRQPGGVFDVACESPCDKWLSPNATYKLIANGVQASSEFTLQGSVGDRVTLHVDPSSRGTMVAGWVIFGVGGSITLIGLLVMAVGALVNASNRAVFGTTTTTTSKTDGDGIVATGGVMALVGVAGMVTGLVIALPNVHTHFDQEVARARTGSDDRWLRVPEWDGTQTRSARSIDAPAAPAFTIFTGRF